MQKKRKKLGFADEILFDGSDLSKEKFALGREEDVEMLFLQKSGHGLPSFKINSKGRTREKETPYGESSFELKKRLSLLSH
jgi:hypothetical protein